MNEYKPDEKLFNGTVNNILIITLMHSFVGLVSGLLDSLSDTNDNFRRTVENSLKSIGSKDIDRTVQLIINYMTKWPEVSIFPVN